jgi:hypothetical protein
LGGGFRTLLTASIKTRFVSAARRTSVKAVPAWLLDFLQTAVDAGGYQMHHDPRYRDGGRAHHASAAHSFKIKAPSLTL